MSWCLNFFWLSLPPLSSDTELRSTTLKNGCPFFVWSPFGGPGRASRGRSFHADPLWGNGMGGTASRRSPWAPSGGPKQKAANTETIKPIHKQTSNETHKERSRRRNKQRKKQRNNQATKQTIKHTRKQTNQGTDTQPKRIRQAKKHRILQTNTHTKNQTTKQIQNQADRRTNNQPSRERSKQRSKQRNIPTSSVLREGPVESNGV